MAIKCHVCKFDRYFNEETARRINRATAYYPYVCEKCGYAIKENYLKMREKEPTWEGTTIELKG